jgi:class 3 adenylate cyclase
MKSNPAPYNHVDGVPRIDEILSGADTSYEELESIPSRDRLSFTNGFYVNCSAMFVDLRKSSSLADTYSRPTLAKIYRSYISECVAVMNGNSNCCEIMIEGDGVAGIFDTPYKVDMDGVFSTAAELLSLVNILNCRFKRYKIAAISAGIGMSWGRALMIKAGHKGSAVHEVVWLGDVVNDAAKLSKHGSRLVLDYPIMVS